MLSFGLSYYVVIALELLYPVYASFKALKTVSVVDDKQWLTYWIVYAWIGAAEAALSFIVSWIPLYYEAKIVFVLWLIAPSTKGAAYLYAHHIEPFLEKHASKLDPVFKRTEQALESKMAAMAARTVETYAPGMAEVVGKQVEQGMSKIASQAMAAINDKAASAAQQQPRD